MNTRLMLSEKNETLILKKNVMFSKNIKKTTLNDGSVYKNFAGCSLKRNRYKREKNVCFIGNLLQLIVNVIFFVETPL